MERVNTPSEEKRSENGKCLGSPTGKEKTLPSTMPHVDGCDPTGSVSKGKPFHCRANGRRRAEVSTQRRKKLLLCNIRRGRRILRAVRRETDGWEDALHREELQENTKWRTWIAFRGWGKSSSLMPKDEHQENTKWKTWIPSRDWGKQHQENTRWRTWIPSREWGKSSSQMPMDVNGTWRARSLAEETGISGNLYQSVSIDHSIRMERVNTPSEEKRSENGKCLGSPTGKEKTLPSTMPHVDGCDPTGSVSKGKPFHCRANGRRRAEVSTQRRKKLLLCNIRRGRRILRAVRRETDGWEDALHREELQENTKWRTWIAFRGWGKSSSLMPKDEHQENTKWKTWIPSRDWGKQHQENTRWRTWIPSREWGKSSSQMPMDVNGTWRARSLAEETGISGNLYQVTMFHV
ncbi:uncharacterized protein LOC129790560 [Lutzomyia longipalpis]|uniref:uncharacterized protein LOC129790560 n=1 Tax=Lutzomyia longipalpis TaxID=7200 RepID=UPI002483778C|nr:uncharacterized protein LOC129790560 [Lutzomyia longipalpis]